MSTILYVQGSPQGELSVSIRVADALIEACRKAHPDDRVATLNVFARDLPPFDGAALAAKYAILHGGRPSNDQQNAWKAVERLIEEFASADKYVFAVPMWNFGIPYRLKHYIDLLVQPGYTFSHDPQQGFAGLLTGRRAAAVYARGGEYSAPQAAGLDHQTSYLETILGFMGITDVRSIVVEPTLAGGPDVARRKTDQAIAQARALAADF